MASNPIAIPADLIELLGDAALSLPELARACRVTVQWVHERVDAGVLALALEARACAVASGEVDVVPLFTDFCNSRSICGTGATTASSSSSS